MYQIQAVLRWELGGLHYVWILSQQWNRGETIEEILTIAIVLYCNRSLGYCDSMAIVEVLSQ